MSPRKKRFLRLAMVAVAVLAVLAGGCQQPKDGRVINLDLGGEPPTIDPSMAEDRPSTQVDELLFLGLTDLDDATTEAGPELADHWEVSADGLTWHFTMRRDAYWVRYDPRTNRFERKRPVTAHDIEYGVLRALDAATASSSAHFLYPLRNAESFNTGKVTDPQEVGVRATGDYEIEFTLERPASHFPGIAGLWIARPLPRELIDQSGERWTEPGVIWTNGPYALASWEHDSKMVMVKNPYYHDARSVSIERINWSMVAEEAGRLSLYRSGKLDTAGFSALPLETLRADARLAKELHFAPGLGTYFLSFNTGKPPFDSQLVRQAFSYALDRQRLVKIELGGGELAAKCLASPGVWGTPAEDPQFTGATFNPELARKLLAEAGYADGKGLPEVTLVFNADRTHEKVAQFAQRSWKEVLGVDVKLVGQEWKEYFRTVRQGPPQVFRAAWGADFPDEGDWLLAFLATRSANPGKWSNPEFDRLVQEAAATTDPGARRQAYARAEQILCVDEAAIIPLYYYIRAILSKPYLERTYSPMGIEHVETWRILPH